MLLSSSHIAMFIISHPFLFVFPSRFGTREAERLPYDVLGTGALREAERLPYDVLGTGVLREAERLPYGIIVSNCAFVLPTIRVIFYILPTDKEIVFITDNMVIERPLINF